MAVANPCLQKEWGEWKRGMGTGRRRKPLRDRIRRWINVEVSDEKEEDSVEEEGEDGNEKEVEKKKEEEVKEEGEIDVEKELYVEEEEEEVKVKENEEEESEHEMGDEEDKSAIDEEVNEVQVTDEADEEEVNTAEEREEEQEEGMEKEVHEEQVDEEEGEKENEKDDEESSEECEENVRQEEQDDEEEEADELQEQNETQFQVESVQQNQESPVQEDGDHNEDNFSDSVESNQDNSDLTGSETESFNSMRLKVEERHEDRYENEMFQAWSTPESKVGEDESERMMITESWTTLEDFQDDLLEEESIDDGEEEHSVDEDGDDEDEVKIYCKDDYPADIFHTLNEFRDSGLLTDLTLSTEDGKSFLVHSPIMAAVSSSIWKNLSRNISDDERKHDVNTWSLTLEVDDVGLEAIVEFAYTGLISRLNKDNVDQIKAAAQTLSAPRVLSFCREEEEASTEPAGKKKRERISAEQQLMMSLQSIKRLWLDRVGCDVVLEALRGSLHVHRVILAVSSDYFRGMFTLGMKESHQPRVSLPFLLASELKVLIDCSYSGVLPLSWSCVFEITSTALQLQYQPALSLCLNFLQKELNPDSCLDVVAFADAYELAQLLEVADDFVLRQFQKVACTSKFKDLPAKQLFKYLNSRSLCVPSELVVFKAVVAWIQAKPKRRLRLAKELMKTIHFPLMTFKEFKEVRSQNMWSDHKLAELYEAIFEEFCSNETTVQNRCRVYLPKESLVLIGGDQITEDLDSRSISRDLWFGNSLRNHTGIKKAMEWRKLGEMPEPARFCHEVAVLKGQLYVFGGKKYYGTGDTLNSVYRYDPLQNSWECMAEMQERRSSFSVVILDGKIYAIGGHCEPNHIDSVEGYCPTTNSWSFMWPLDLPLSGHVAKVLRGHIFVSGGRNNDYLCLSSMFMYNPETGSTYLANMTKPRAHHCMEALADFLYVAGGITTDDDVTVIDQLACEVYSPATDTWTAFTQLPVPHVGAGSAVLEGKFYVLGGYSQEDYSDTKMVHRFDATTWRWENMGKMPGPNNDIRASLLCLPKHFRL